MAVWVLILRWFPQQCGRLTASIVAALGVEAASIEWVQRHIETLSKASHSLSKPEEAAADRAAEVCKFVLQVAVQAHVDKAADRPMIRSSQSDGTPSRV